ncbi:MAG: hypothetical protein Q8M92_00550, partial [Candidatus Subteraquimicrobiales bacterium]|nr:hypothetical protein [Candidatus Subteraquimicrobiales bacterium]
MMEKKRSVGVTVFGFIETIIGVLGTLVFILCLVMVIQTYTSHRRTAGVGGAIGMSGMVLSLPFIFFLWA